MGHLVVASAKGAEGALDGPGPLAGRKSRAERRADDAKLSDDLEYVCRAA